MIELSKQKGLIFRITHIANVPWILDHGVHCRSSGLFDPGFREIGNPDLIGKRASRVVPVSPGGTLSDYVPFYFTPFSPMLFNIKTGYNGMKQTPMPDVVILVTSVHKLVELGLPFVITDRHAYLQAAQYANDAVGLGMIDWQSLRARDFKRDPDKPEKMERYQAETLVHRQVPLEALLRIVCHGETQKAQIDAELTRRRRIMKLVVTPDWYF